LTRTLLSRFHEGMLSLYIGVGVLERISLYHTVHYEVMRLCVTVLR